MLALIDYLGVNNGEPKGEPTESLLDSLISSSSAYLSIKYTNTEDIIPINKQHNL